MPRIDAHQHFWNPARGDYDWMPKENPVLARPYAPSDLHPHLRAHGIAKTVLVQAAATVNETEYLLGIADATAWVAGVVGWISFENRSDLKALERLSQHPKFLGVRPMIQDIPDLGWMLRDDVQWGFEALIDLDLSFDALGFPQHLENFHRLLTRHPDLRVVIDHCMKPQIRDHARNPQAFQDWARGIARLARETSAFCKLSGLVTEAAESWTIDDLRPSAEHVLDVFGPERVMWGSDWPVCQLRADYDQWHAAAHMLTAPLGAAAQRDIFGSTARLFYRLPA